MQILKYNKLMGGLMKAILYNGMKNVKIDNVKDPEIKEDDDIIEIEE